MPMDGGLSLPAQRNNVVATDIIMPYVALLVNTGNCSIALTRHLGVL